MKKPNGNVDYEEFIAMFAQLGKKESERDPLLHFVRELHKQVVQSAN